MNPVPAQLHEKPWLLLILEQIPFTHGLLSQGSVGVVTREVIIIFKMLDRLPTFHKIIHTMYLQAISSTLTSTFHKQSPC